MPLNKNKINPTDKRFQSGIYNYCDRWCERCPDTAKCFLYAQEQKTKKIHIERGEDPDDPEIAMQDMMNNFKEAHHMLNKEMKRMGITPADIDMQPIEDEPDFDSHPLVKKATQYFKDAHKFLNEFHYNQQKMVMQFGIEITDQDIEESLKVVSWYHSMLSSKAFRLVSEVHNAKIEKNPELKEIIIEDLPKFFNLVNKCITQSQTALNSLVKKRQDYKNKITPLINLLNQISLEVDKLK